MLLRLVSITLAAWTVHASSNESGATLRSSTKSGDTPRKLSYDQIANYVPESLVTDHNAIDLDQKYIEKALENEDTTGFNNALAIYEKGGNSKTIAELELKDGLPKSLAAESLLLGYDENNHEIKFTLYENANIGTKKLRLRYSTITVQEFYNQCRVGGLQLVDRVTTGCLRSMGVIKDSNGDAFEYNSGVINYNKRSLQYLSTEVESKMLDCVNCPYKDAGMFSKYYGQADYGNMWIMAAFEGKKTLFDNGNADFSQWGYTGRSECIKKGTVYMNVFMFVLREFENGLDYCDDKMFNDAVHAWDKGVAYYTGSAETETGSDSGYLLHQLADKRCKNFKTCGINGDLYESTSQVNHEFLNLAMAGQEQVKDGLCGQARKTKEKIADIMYIPLIQGTLRYAHKMRKTSVTEKEKGEGAVFAAAVLPRVHAASSDSAKIIYDNMRVGAPSTDFKLVKEAFEAVYKNMKIGCNEVGGVVTDSGAYASGASPCTVSDDGTDDDDKGGDDGADDDDKGGDDGADDGSDSSLVLGAVLGSVAGILFLGGIGAAMFIRGRESEEESPVFETNEHNQTLD